MDASRGVMCITQECSFNVHRLQHVKDVELYSRMTKVRQDTGKEADIYWAVLQSWHACNHAMKFSSYTAVLLIYFH